MEILRITKSLKFQPSTLILNVLHGVINCIKNYIEKILFERYF